MSTFHADTVVPAPAERVLEALVDPAALARWSPVPFRLVTPHAGRLRTGTRAHVDGGLAGIGASFVVHVRHIDGECVDLQAAGPVVMDVGYRLRSSALGTEVHAKITVGRGRGLLSRALTAATERILHAGGLSAALARLSREAQRAQAEPSAG